MLSPISRPLVQLLIHCHSPSSHRGLVVRRARLTYQLGLCEPAQVERERGEVWLTVDRFVRTTGATQEAGLQGDAV